MYIEWLGSVFQGYQRNKELCCTDYIKDKELVRRLTYFLNYPKAEMSYELLSMVSR